MSEEEKNGNQAEDESTRSQDEEHDGEILSEDTEILVEEVISPVKKAGLVLFSPHRVQFSVCIIRHSTYRCAVYQEAMVQLFMPSQARD